MIIKLQHAAKQDSVIMSKVQVHLFRHGETDWNAEKRIQGHSDIPLNARGQLQARELASRLNSHGIQAIASSDLLRARETAEIVGRHLGISIACDPEFREAKLGEVEGLLLSEINVRFGDAAWLRWRSMKKCDLDFCFFGGETKRQAVTRVYSALNKFVKDCEFDILGISTHGMVLRLLIHSLLPVEHEPISIGNCASYIIERDRVSVDERWRCISL
jgi:probable phosphoglycerate mutase